jgi:hypothetical protein
MRPEALNTDIDTRLRQIIGWTALAKENLPAINNAIVAADKVAAASALLDRMYRAAIALTAAKGTTAGAEYGRRAA